MASNVKPSIALFLSLNLFLLVSSRDVNYNSNGSSSPTNSGNPVIIPPGYELPNGNNTQGKSGTCNPLNLGVCLNLLGLVDVELGNLPTQPCCSVIEGLLDLEAAVCLCTAVRANVLGININLPISLNVLLNNCGRRVTTEYICSSDDMDSHSKGSSTTNPTNPVDNNSNGSSSNPTNPVDNNSNGSSSTTNPTNPVNYNSNGSSSPTNSGNPVVITPGYELPNGKSGTCNPLNLGVCANLLGLVDVELGNVPTRPCCSLIEGLVDLEAAVCLCTAVRANVLGININLPISLSLLLNNCGREVATEYICSA